MKATGFRKVCHLAFLSVYLPLPSLFYSSHSSSNISPELKRRSKDAPAIVNQVRGCQAVAHSQGTTAGKANTTTVATATDLNNF